MKFVRLFSQYLHIAISAIFVTLLLASCGGGNDTTSPSGSGGGCLIGGVDSSDVVCKETTAPIEPTL